MLFCLSILSELPLETVGGRGQWVNFNLLKALNSWHFVICLNFALGSRMIGFSLAVKRLIGGKMLDPKWLHAVLSRPNVAFYFWGDFTMDMAMQNVAFAKKYTAQKTCKNGNRKTRGHDSNLNGTITLAWNIIVGHAILCLKEIRKNKKHSRKLLMPPCIE